jgi:hypothetical protein
MATDAPYHAIDHGEFYRYAVTAGEARHSVSGSSGAGTTAGGKMRAGGRPAGSGKRVTATT